MTVRWKYFLSTLVLMAVMIWLAVFVHPDTRLHLVACDVGQGDAILATLGGTQILVDGGGNSKVLACLSRHMPYWDKKLEIVILTHQQVDHFRGLIEVFEDYDVDVFLTTPLDSGSQEFEVLKNLVGGSGVKIINPTAGTVIRYGVIYLDILHPPEQFLLENTDAPTDLGKDNVLGSYTTSRDLNEFSLVFILRFEDFEALLAGDIGATISDEIADTLALSANRGVEYIKIPHHGSKNGLTEDLLIFSNPEIAVISVGKDNIYGHPHEEVLDMLSRYRLRVFRTDEMGDVEIVTDGEKVWLPDEKTTFNITP